MSFGILTLSIAIYNSLYKILLKPLNEFESKDNFFNKKARFEFLTKMIENQHSIMFNYNLYSFGT